MFEIVPNWHPVAVHFTVALLALAVALSLIARVLPVSAIRDELIIVARWSLWLGTLLAILTAIAGWYAYNSVAHDDISHAAMTDHRNWALVTLALFVFLASWSSVLWWHKRAPAKGVAGIAFLLALAVGGLLLASTAWRGAELVYRYGLGVMALPAADTDAPGHAHAGNEALHAVEHAEIATPAGPVSMPVPAHNPSTHVH